MNKHHHKCLHSKTRRGKWV